MISYHHNYKSWRYKQHDWFSIYNKLRLMYLISIYREYIKDIILRGQTSNISFCQNIAKKNKIIRLRKNSYRIWLIKIQLTKLVFLCLYIVIYSRLKFKSTVLILYAYIHVSKTFQRQYIMLLSCTCIICISQLRWTKLGGNTPNMFECLWFTFEVSKR